MPLGLKIRRKEPRQRPSAVVLILHGGKPRSTAPVRVTSLAWLRMALMQEELAADLRELGAASWLLRFGVRGWNGSAEGGPSPVIDARRALDRVREDHPGVPVVLLGHSMGARTAIAVAGNPAVTGVVALAPWIEPGDSDRHLAGRRLIAAHARADRVTSFGNTAAFVERARTVARSAQMVDMGPLDHAMLRERRRWNEFAAGAVAEIIGSPTL